MAISVHIHPMLLPILDREKSLWHTHTRPEGERRGIFRPRGKKGRVKRTGKMVRTYKKGGQWKELETLNEKKCVHF